MELKTTHKEVHCKPITAITVNPLRREVITGSEDGVIKVWESETGKTVQTLHKHQGWVTDLYYWQEAKLLVSASNDGILATWSSSSVPHQVIRLSDPIYCIAWNSKREQIIIGLNKCVKAFSPVEGTSLSSPYLNEKCETVSHHSDIVKAIVCMESRVYTASFDRAIVLYETSSYPSDKTLHLVSAFRHAHAAAITCLTTICDSDSNTWQILSGSFDRCVKIWTQDIQLIHKIEGLSGTVTSISYIPLTKVLWVSCGLQDVLMFDPKSGENITECVSGRKKGDNSNKFQLLLLRYVPELGEVYSTTNRRTVLAWKYNPFAAISTLQCKGSPEGLAYTGKSPILIFTGDCQGQITKWEQLQLNNFMYSADTFNLQDATRTLQYSNYDDLIALPNSADHKSRSVNKMCFVEDLDLLVAGSEDSNIYLWGFDDQAMTVLRDTDSGIGEVFSCMEDDTVTNRVAGFTCKRVLNRHSQAVTGLAVVPQQEYLDHSYLLSCGNDRRICLWNLSMGTLTGSYCVKGNSEGSGDDALTDIAYAQSRQEFAYSCMDRLIYIRKFATKTDAWSLVHILQGHDAEVTHLLWNPLTTSWVSGGDDCTLRVWHPERDYLKIATSVTETPCPVTALTFDTCNGALIVGLQDIIRVYEGRTLKQLQTHTGHMDSVRALLHVAERAQYISISWDNTISVWNAYKPHIRHNNTPADI